MQGRAFLLSPDMTLYGTGWAAALVENWRRVCVGLVTSCETYSHHSTTTKRSACTILSCSRNRKVNIVCGPSLDMNARTKTSNKPTASYRYKTNGEERPDECGHEAAPEAAGALEADSLSEAVEQAAVLPRPIHHPRLRNVRRLPVKPSAEQRGQHSFQKPGLQLCHPGNERL